jgi:hypothetical protein
MKFQIPMSYITDQGAKAIMSTGQKCRMSCFLTVSDSLPHTDGLNGLWVTRWTQHSINATEQNVQVFSEVWVFEAPEL